MGRSPSEVRHRVIVVGLLLVRVWLTIGQPVYAMGPGNHDERLFLLLARSLLNGDWLGVYGNLTLAKGPVYPLWIAGVALLGAPLLLAQALLYATACVYVAEMALSPVLNLGGRTLILGVLLFNPVSWADGPATRVVREGIYPALSLLVFGALWGLLLRLDRPHAPWGWALALGGFGGAYWMTREEGVWLAPAAVLSLAAVWPMSRNHLRRSVLLLGGASLVALASWASVATLNLRAYGAWTVVEFRDRPFLRAYGSLLRIDAGEKRRWAHITSAARTRAYAVSPSFHELAPYLEGGVGRMWERIGCGAFGVCGNLSDGMFMWALRDAARDAGHYRSADEAAHYYGRVADEIEAACASKRLKCTAARASMRPALRAAEARLLWQEFRETALHHVQFRDCRATPTRSFGTEDQLSLFHDLTGERLSGDEARTIVTGWVLAGPGEASLTLLDARTQAVSTAVVRFPRPDVNALEPGSGTWQPPGFTAEGSCGDHCLLEVTKAGSLLGRVEVKPGASLEAATGLRIYVDGAASTFPVQARVVAGKLAALDAITRAYAVVQPWGLLCAGAALMFLVCTRWLTRPMVLLVAAAALIAVLSRWALIALIETTSFRAIGTVYLCPAYPFLMLFEACILVEAARVFRARRLPRSKDSSS